jgi:hypothetical protein
MTTKSSPKADAVRAYLVKNKTATPAEVAKATGVSYGYVYKLMQKIGTPKEVFIAEEEATSTGKKPQTANLRQVGGEHYVGLSVEPWEAMEAWMTKDEFIGFLKGNIIKYLAREKNANDLDKAGHYMQKLLEVK